MSSSVSGTTPPSYKENPSDLPLALHRALGPLQRHPRVPLRGVDAPRLLGPTHQRPPARQEQGQDHPRILGERGQPTVCADLAGRRTSAGTVPETQWPHQRPLPDLCGEPARTPEGLALPEDPVLQAACERALAKAREHEWWRLVAPQLARSNFQQWRIPSRTEPGQYHTVWRARPTAFGWWNKLDCSCPAIASGKYLVCWHKAAVAIRCRLWPQRW